LSDFGRGRRLWRAFSASRRSNTASRGRWIRAAGPYSGRPQLAELVVQQLALLIEPQEFLVKLLLALLEVGELLLDGRTQLPEIFGGIVSNGGAGYGKDASRAEKQCRRRQSKAATPVSRPVVFCKPMRPHQAARCGLP